MSNLNKYGKTQTDQDNYDDFTIWNVEDEIKKGNIEKATELMKHSHYTAALDRLRVTQAEMVADHNQIVWTVFPSYTNKKMDEMSDVEYDAWMADLMKPSQAEIEAEALLKSLPSIADLTSSSNDLIAQGDKLIAEAKELLASIKPKKTLEELQAERREIEERLKVSASNLMFLSKMRETLRSENAYIETLEDRRTKATSVEDLKTLDDEWALYLKTGKKINMEETVQGFIKNASKQ